MEDSKPEASIGYEMDRNRKRVWITLEGPVTADAIEEYMRVITEDPEYHRDYDVIVDLRRFHPTFSQKGLQRLAMFVRQHPGNPGARRAVIVAEGPASEMSRAFEALTFLSPVIYRSFRTEEAVEAWLAEPHCGRPEGSHGTPYE